MRLLHDVVRCDRRPVDREDRHGETDHYGGRDFADIVGVSDE